MSSHWGGGGEEAVSVCFKLSFYSVIFSGVTEKNYEIPESG